MKNAIVFNTMYYNTLVDRASEELDSFFGNSYNTLVDRASEELDSFFGNSYYELQLIATWLTCRKGLTMLSPGEKF